MKPVFNLPWPNNEKEALELQRALVPKVVQYDAFETIDYVAGVDVAYGKDDKDLYAAAIVLDAQTLEIVDTSIAQAQVSFPYIPGLFTFREVPPLVTTLEGLKVTPDLIVCDGQGLAHPRRFGLACHLGVLFDVPTIGCGKTLLIGEYEVPGLPRGSREPLLDEDETVGAVVRTQDSVKPVFVSVGHRISLDTACHWILKLSPNYRLPETTRAADQAVKRVANAKVV